MRGAHAYYNDAQLALSCVAASKTTSSDPAINAGCVRQPTARPERVETREGSRRAARWSASGSISRKDIFVVVPTLTAYYYTYKANSEQEHAEQSSQQTETR